MKGWTIRLTPQAVPQRLGTDPVWPHHLVVLVLDDVAVPDEAACPIVSRLRVISPGYAMTVSFPPLTQS